MSLEHALDKSDDESALCFSGKSSIENLNSTDIACKILGVGKTSLYKYMKEGKIRAIKIGKLTKIPDSSIREFIDSAPAYADEV